MSISEAYCIECKESISISKAVGISASNKGKRLNFFCADDSCREAFKPRIVGVNYRSRGEKAEDALLSQAKQAHFRIEYRDPHRVGCLSVSSDRARVLPVKKRRGVLSVRRGSKIDSRQIIERFEPFEIVEEDSGGQITDVELTGLQAAKNRQERDEIIRRAFKENPVRSNQMEKLVDDYEWLKSVGLDSVTTISGVPTSFSKLWFDLAYAKLNEPARLWRAQAQIVQTNGGYAIRFYDAPGKVKTTKRPPTASEPNMSIFLSAELLKKTTRRPRLFTELREISVSNGALYATIYLFGKPTRHPTNAAAFNIEIADLRHLAIRREQRGTKTPAKAQLGASV